MVNRFACLRHHTIISCDHQNDDIGRFGPTRPHRRKGFMARRIEEGDHATRGFDVISTDMLRNAACFTRGNPRPADIVKQRGFAVIDVAHDGHHGRARQLRRILMFGFTEEGVWIVELGSKSTVPHFLDENHRRFLIKHLIDGDHRPHFHQRLDDFSRFHGHLVSQVRDRNGLRHMHVMHHGFGRLLEAMHFVGIMTTATTLAGLAIAPAGTALSAPRLQPLALAATLVLPRPFLVTNSLLAIALLVGDTRLAGGLVQCFVFRWTIGHIFRSSLLRRFCGTCRHCLFFGILLQAHQFGRALLLF